ncbi:MAG: hypothetical protein H3C39_00545 [Flavobacteriia bacterium]|nr:hypothetical protein [Flavobacteriia bacterium]
MKTNNYFFQSFLTLAFAAVIFYTAKPFLPERLFEETKTDSKNIIIDSLMIQAANEAENNPKTGKNDSTELSNQIPKEYDGNEYLIRFYEALRSLENDSGRKVRIAYYGDSMIDGDLITQDLREHFQDRFGGGGVGFVPITSESAKSRASIVHQFSSDWKDISFVTNFKPKPSFGLSGHVFFITDSIGSAWLKIRPTAYKKHNSSLDQITLYYGKSKNRSGTVNLQPLIADSLLNSIRLSPKGNIADLQFRHAAEIPFYGVSLDEPNGLNLDNFSSRGNSGLPFSLFDTQLMNDFDKSLDYDLIVLHFGANVLSYGKKDYSWYGNSMTKVVNHLKECFPNTDILIISTADKASKVDGKMQTDPSVAHLLEAQRNYAMLTQSGFLDLYDLMGGENSMVNWVDSEPSMANKDYTHFNSRGAEKIAGLIYNQIIKGYEDFKKNN